MDVQDQKQESNTSEATDKQKQTAIPYTPPPPPNESGDRSLRTPRANALIFAGLILLVGFMAYNFAGHELTQLASESEVRSVSTPTPTPTNVPSDVPLPSGSTSVTPTASY